MDTTTTFTSTSGYNYTLDLDVLDDWDLWTNELTVMEDKDAPRQVRDTATLKVFTLLIGGDEEFTKLKDFLRDKDGKKVRKTAVEKEMVEVFQYTSKPKKK